MESKEVITLVKNLEKSKANDDTVIEILSVLDRDLKPTEKLAFTRNESGSYG